MNIAFHFLVLLTGASLILTKPISKSLATRLYDPDYPIYDSFPADTLKLASNNVVEDGIDPTSASLTTNESNEGSENIDSVLNNNSPAIAGLICRPNPQGARSIEDSSHHVKITCNGGQAPGDCKACNKRKVCEDLGISCGVDYKGTSQCILIGGDLRIDLTIQQSEHLLPIKCVPDSAPL